MQLYQKAVKRIDRSSSNQEEILELEQYLLEHRIMCTKYNSSFEKMSQRQFCYQAFIELSPCMTYLRIVNRKPNNNTKYTMESDPRLVKELQLRELQL